MNTIETAGRELQDRVTVVLVDDHAIWRDGVSSLLEDTEFEVVGEAASGLEALNVVREMRPRLVLLDIRMAGGDGLDTLQVLKQSNPDVAVIMLTTYDNPTYMARAVAGGAAGYVLKGVPADDLLTAMRAAAAGELLLRPQDLVRALRGISPDTAGQSDLIKPLSAREIEVLRLMSTGLNNKAIADILFISEATVKTHVGHILNKIGVSDRIQAIVWAVRHGLVKLDDIENRDGRAAG